LCSEIKAINKDIHIAFHSDGCVYDIIPGLIEAGVDVLNPIQTECVDPGILKKKYGKNLCFFGGVAVQSTLPTGTPEDIRKEYQWLKETLGKDGGWLCAPTHHVQLDTPIENFMQLVECVNK
jgi:uroporphyrinogen decarboxylase